MVGQPEQMSLKGTIDTEMHAVLDIKKKDLEYLYGQNKLSKKRAAYAFLLSLLGT